ncbi:basic amino acid ABC transporter substrate-binding protein [Polycladospora coralii]
MRKLGLTMLLIGALSFTALGCGNNEATDTDKSKGEQMETIKIGTDAAYPPFEKQEGNGDITGFDIEVLDAIAKASGLEYTIENTGWDPLFYGIDNGKIDAGISAITITDERKEKYDFTEPYFEAKQVILLPKDSTVTSLKGLEGKNIGVQSATTGEVVVQQAFGKTYENLKGYDDTPSAIEDLKLGRLDAVVADNGVLLEYAKKLGSDKFKVIEDASFEPEYYGIITKKGNTQLLDKLNEGLKKIKEDGTYDKIYAKYFGAE